MKIITAEDITDSTLTSSSVTEADHAAWDSATTYALNDYVIVTTPNVHKIYKSAQGANTNHNPVTDTGTWWTDEGSTNRWKMFNTTVQQQTVKSGGFNVVITPATIISGLSVVNADCESITVLMTDPVEGVVYNQTFSMISSSGISSWYSYFFTPISRDTDLAVLGLPTYASAVTTVTFTGTGDVKCGALVMGVSQTIGISQYGASFGIMDYSTKATDSAGNVTITAGSFSDTAEVDVIIETARFAEVKRILTSVRSIPTVWITEENTDGLIIYGYFREFNILMTNPNVSLTTLAIEGLN